MKYTKEERLLIGQEVYEGKLSIYDAANKYDICHYTARDYCRQYKALNGLSQPYGESRKKIAVSPTPVRNPEAAAYEKMSREELIDALILAKANELRAKKGYMVKGDGPQKEFVTLLGRNTK